MKILIIGDSHVHAIQLATVGFVGSAEFEVHRVGAKANSASSRFLLIRDASQLVRRLTAADVLVVSFGGTSHNPVSLLRHPEPFDVLAPGEEAGELPIITQSALRAAFMYPSWSQRGKIEAFKVMTAARVFHIAMPPPTADHEFISRQRISYRGRSFTKEDLNPASLRLKIWNIEMQTLVGVCKECGVGFVYSPEDSRTPEGYLARQYYANDAAHANQGYGKHRP